MLRCAALLYHGRLFLERGLMFASPVPLYLPGRTNAKVGNRRVTVPRSAQVRRSGEDARYLRQSPPSPESYLRRCAPSFLRLSHLTQHLHTKRRKKPPLPVVRHRFTPADVRTAFGWPTLKHGRVEIQRLETVEEVLCSLILAFFGFVFFPLPPPPS